MAAEDVFLEAFNDMFELDSFCENYLKVQHIASEIFGFTDDMTDAQKLEEAKWVPEQFRKFTNTKRRSFEKFKESPMMLSTAIGEALKDSQEYAMDRKHMLYNYMRDEWLRMFNAIVMEYVDMNEDEEDW